MKFYRSLNPIKAISFDLDDTLYSNHTNMVAAEQAMVCYFAEQLSTYADSDKVFDYRYWRTYRKQVITQSPAVGHDVTELRRQTYLQGIVALGVDSDTALQLAQNALAFFLAKRSDFKVPQESKDLLAYLSARVPLVAISNGNVDMQAIGLDQYFSHAFLAGEGRLKKPADDMFLRASDALQLPLKNILHVGDCGHADIKGALGAGMMTAWLSCYDVGKPISVLPHLELTAVTQLDQLL